MIRTYKAKCQACNVEYHLDYGSKNKRKIIYETFSCPSCNHLFSLSNNKKLACPNCGNEDLYRYNLNKNQNISYYRKMYEKKLLSIDKYQEIVSFWKTVKCDECPKCGRNELEWIPLR